MEPTPDTQIGMPDNNMQDEGNEEFELGPGDERLAAMIERARESKRAVVITRSGRPMAAIIDFDELVQLEQLVDDLDAKAIALEYEAQDARGEVAYLTEDEFKEYMDKIVAEATKRAARKDAKRSTVPGK